MKLPLALFGGSSLLAGTGGATGFVLSQPRSFAVSQTTTSITGSRLSTPPSSTHLYSTRSKNEIKSKDQSKKGKGSANNDAHTPFTFTKQSRYDATANKEEYKAIQQAQAGLMKQVQQLETKAALSSLKELLERQKTDMEETEQLLQTMEATMESIEEEEANNANNNAANIDSAANLFNIGGDYDTQSQTQSESQTEAQHSITPTPSLFQTAKHKAKAHYHNDTRTASILAAANYGFKSRSEGGSTTLVGGTPDDSISGLSGEPFPGYGPPGNLWDLGWQQFWRNLKAMRGEYEEDYEDHYRTAILPPRQRDLQQDLIKLKLNTTAIWEREGNDPAANHDDAPLIVKVPYYALCVFLDKVFENRYVPSRFFFLETVARMPYFSYIGMLHMYETLGFWRRSATVKRIHFAEEWNEFHHLLIMESLGGDQRWWVRFLAQHSAIAYFFALVALFAMSPSSSYKFSEMLETHAFHTYSQFLEENEDLLKKLPPPTAAVEYYTIGASDPLFSEYQTGTSPKKTNGETETTRTSSGRSTQMHSLFDVFSAIRDDERDHVSTMQACLDPTVAVRSPATQRNFLTGLALTAAVSASLVATGGVEGLADLDLTSILDTLSGSVDMDQSALTDALTNSGGALEGATDAFDAAELMSGASGIMDAVLAGIAAAAASGTQALRDGELGAGELGAAGAEGELGGPLWEAVAAILFRIL